MTLQEKIGFFLFLVIAIGIFVSAGGILIRIAWALIKDEPLEQRPAVRRYRAVMLTLAAAGLVAVAYGRFVEPYWPSETYTRVESPRMPAGTTIRIVHLSDIHSDATPRLEERLPALVAAQKPDLIVFSGDAANSEQGLPTFQKCLRELTAVAPVYAVRGNWDLGLGVIGGPFAGTGATELDDTSTVVTVRNQPVRIAGARIRLGPYDTPPPDDSVSTLLASLPGTEPTVFVHHYPDRILDAAASKRVDVMCAGHTHGGQVALPLYGALITLSRFGKRFESGTYDVDGTTLHVSRGIGMEGSSAPRVRFCARPEIAVVDLVGVGSGGK